MHRRILNGSPDAQCHGTDEPDAGVTHQPDTRSNLQFTVRNLFLRRQETFVKIFKT